jgi:cytochrome c-type biogenesis protein CcmH
LKDIKYIALFVALGLILAYATSSPLRKKAAHQPRVGTPLEMPTAHQGSSGAEDRVYVQGTINVAATLPLDVTRRVLFIIAKSPAGGPPVAVRRVEAPTFPLTFALTPANNMVGGDFYEGDLILAVRLDKDGAAGPKQPDDIEVVTQVPAASDRRVAVTLTNQ